MCEYCKARQEGVEYKAKNRIQKGFNELIEEHGGSILKARNAIKVERHLHCTCKELALKVQCSSSIQSGYDIQHELNSMLQEILIADANKGSHKDSNGTGSSSNDGNSKQTMISLFD